MAKKDIPLRVWIRTIRFRHIAGLAVVYGATQVRQFSWWQTGLVFASIFGTWLLHIVTYRKSPIYKKGLDGMLEGLAIARCHAYIVWWNANAPLRRAVTNGTVFVLAGASIPAIYDVVALFWGREDGPLPLKHLELPLPWWAQMLIVLGAIYMFIHRLLEWERANERSQFTTAMRLLLREISVLDFSGCDDPTRFRKLDVFVTKVLEAFYAIFKKRLKANLNVMAMTADEHLRIHYVFPIEVKNKYDAKAAFRSGQGAAGKAFEMPSLIYVPAIRQRHGITIRLAGSPDPSQPNRLLSKSQYDMATSVYVKVDSQPYKSILIAPIILANGDGYGVLNIDSMVQNGFDEADMEIADVAASTLSMAFDRFRASA